MTLFFCPTNVMLRLFPSFFFLSLTTDSFLDCALLKYRDVCSSVIIYDILFWVSTQYRKTHLIISTFFLLLRNRKNDQNVFTGFFKNKYAYNADKQFIFSE